MKHLLYSSAFVKWWKITYFKRPPSYNLPGWVPVLRAFQESCEVKSSVGVVVKRAFKHLTRLCFLNISTGCIMCTSSFLKDRGNSFPIFRKNCQVIIWILWSLAPIFMTCHKMKVILSQNVLFYIPTLPSTAHHLINYSLPQECSWLNNKLTRVALLLDLQRLELGHDPSEP